jgi:hypothetical protein
MKKIKLSAITLTVLLFTITGCEKTEEDPITDDRDKFIGTWDGQSNGPGGQRSFNLVITASNSAPDQILMDNFDGGSGIVYANVNGNSLAIPSQIVSGETIAGSGNFTGSTINFTFTIDDGQGVENRTAIASNKQ